MLVKDKEMSSFTSFDHFKSFLNLGNRRNHHSYMKLFHGTSQFETRV